MSYSQASAPSRGTRGRVIAALTGILLVAAGLMPATAAQAAPGNPDDLYIDSYLGYGSSGTRLFNDFKILNGAVTDATSVRVTVKRTVGPDVVKESKPGASFFTTLNSGGMITAPIVLQAGTTDEAASSSWYKPEGAVWTAETIPTSVTIEIFTADGLALARTVTAPSVTYGITIAEMLPPAPTMRIRNHNYAVSSTFSGMTVNFEVEGFSDAEEVRVSVARSDGSTYLKVSKQSVIDKVNDGTYRILSAPVIMKPGGTYDEPGSSSWYMPTGLWTSQTIPTSVTVTIVRTYGPDVTLTSTAFNGSVESVLPEPSAPIQVTVPTDVPDGGSFDVVIPAGQTGGELTLGTAVGGSLNVPVPVTVSSPVGVSVAIPANTTVTATGPDAATWDGGIDLPTVVDVEIPSTQGPATVGLAIEVGSPTMRLTFDKPVKLVLAGQAGQKAGFVQGGVFTAITTQCSADPAADLVDGECWNTSGDDLVIWTTHFTTFVAYDLALAATGSAVAAPLLGVVGVLGLAGVGLVLLGRRRGVVA